MKTLRVLDREWSVEATDPPKLSSQQWNIVSLVGVILLVMAILQIASFNEFKNTLEIAGLSGPTAWAVVIIAAEILAAVGFFKLRLSHLLRVISSALAVLVGAFWFALNLKLVTVGAEGKLDSSGFFGKFLEQTPGWWTVVGVTILLFLTLYSVELVENSLSRPKKRA